MVRLHHKFPKRNTCLPRESLIVPAKRIRCQAPGCRRKFWASRSDSMFCSEKCRYRTRAENAKFDCPQIPKSGVAGVTFNRILKRWEARLVRKYLGSFKQKEDAIKFRRKVLGQ